MSRISPRLVSVLVTGDDLDGFAAAAPTSHLKVFLPADGQDAPNLPEFTPGRRRLRRGRPRPTVRTYTPRRYDPATRPWRSSSSCTARAPRRSGRSGPSPATSSRSPAPAAGFPLSRPRTTGGSPPTSPRSRPSAPCSTRSPRRPPSTRTSRSTAQTTRSSSTAPRRPDHLAPPARRDAFGAELAAAAARRTSPTVPDLGRLRGGRDARHPPLLHPRARHPGRPLVTRGYWRAGEQNHPDHDYGED